MDRPIVVIGIGNLLLSDDAVGIRVIEALAALAEADPSALPAGTRLVDGGTAGVDLAGMLQDVAAAVLVDATWRRGRPGSVSVLRGDAILAAEAATGSGGQGPIGNLLALARLMGGLPASITLVGIEAADIGFAVRLSAPVAAAVPVAVDAVRRELHRIHLPVQMAGVMA